MKARIYFIKSFLLLIIIIFISFYSYSYNYNINDYTELTASKIKPKLVKRKTKRNFNIALNHIDNYEFDEALPILLKLLKKDTDNLSINFFVGVCYLETNASKSIVEPYFEKSIKNTIAFYSGKYSENRAPAFAFYYLALLYLRDYKFDEAINNYLKFKSLIPSGNKYLINNVNNQIQKCYNAKALFNKPSSVNISQISDINSTFSDYAAQIISDGTAIYFSSKRKGIGNEKNKDGQYKSDIYISEKKGKNWSKSEIIKNISGTANDNFCCISNDGNYLFFSSDRDENKYDIYYCMKKDDNQWSAPYKLNDNINSKFNETFARISNDGNTLYFVSDRRGGYGGKDIYKSKKMIIHDWGKAENFGKQINTSYDEESPFFSDNEKTLFFSSKGHQNIGGFDVFYSKFDNNEWAKPMNLGYPINTTYDDLYFNLLNKQTTALYTSSKKGVGISSDIFFVNNFNLKYLKNIENLLAEVTRNHPVIKDTNLINIENIPLYTVQIGAGKSMKINSFSVLYGVKECTGTDGLKRFIIGEFKTREQAEALKQEIIKLGYTDAWIPPIDENRSICK
jgi:hypothetical protein